MKPVVILLLLATPLFADQVTVKNGDHITGTIARSDAKSLVIKTDYAGEVTIAWDAVTAITSTAPLNIALKDGQVIVGTVTTTADGRFAVATRETGVLTVGKDTVVVIRSGDEQAALQAEMDHLRNPRLVDLWTGFFDLGYANTHGNANTSSFSVSANASRATARDKIAAYYTSVFSSSNASGPTITTADAKRGGIRYDLNLAPKWFAFGSVDLESDQFQSLDLRFVPAGGGGYHAIKNASAVLDFSFGGSADREFFSTGLDRSAFALVTGEEFDYKVGKSSVLQQKLFFYPDAKDFGDNRINFDVTAATTLRRWLSWQVTASDRYISNPVPGRKSNDTLFTTGLRLTFAK